MVYDVKAPYPQLSQLPPGSMEQCVAARRWYSQELDENGFVRVRYASSIWASLTGKPEKFFGQQKTTSEMSRQELGEYIDLFQQSGLQVNDFVVDYHLKWGYLGHLVFVF